jgi:hypothetical protein
MKLFSSIFSVFGKTSKRKTSKRKTRAHIKRKFKTRRNRGMKGG